MTSSNTHQILGFLKSAVLAQTWTGGVNRVFHPGSVLVTVGTDEQALSTMVSPICLIRPLDAEIDPQHKQEPDLVAQRVAVRIITIVPGDAVGEAALMGGNKTQGATNSHGKGLLEIEEELFNAIKILNAKEAVLIQHRASSAAEATLDPVFGYVAIRDYLFEILTSTTAT